MDMYTSGILHTFSKSIQRNKFWHRLGRKGVVITHPIRKFTVNYSGCRTRRRLLIQLQTVVSRRRRNQLYSTAMRAYVNTVSLTAVCVIAYVVNLAPVVSQCTTRHCLDDDNDLSVLVTRLQHSMEQQQIQVTKLEDTLAKQNECTFVWLLLLLVIIVSPIVPLPPIHICFAQTEFHKVMCIIVHYPENGYL